MGDRIMVLNRKIKIHYSDMIRIGWQQQKKKLFGDSKRKKHLLVFNSKSSISNAGPCDVFYAVFVHSASYN